MFVVVLTVGLFAGLLAGIALTGAARLRVSVAILIMATFLIILAAFPFDLGNKTAFIIGTLSGFLVSVGTASSESMHDDPETQTETSPVKQCSGKT